MPVPRCVLLQAVAAMMLLAVLLALAALVELVFWLGER